MARSKNGKSKQAQKTESARFSRKLPVKITKREVDEKSAEYVEVMSAIEEKKVELAGLSKPIRDEIAELRTKGESLRKQAHTGIEERDVACVHEFDYSGGEVHTIRIDTRAKVDSRTMTAEEREMTFPAVGGGKGGKGRPAADAGDGEASEPT